MSLSRYRGLSCAVLLFAAACGDGDPVGHVVDTPAAEVDPSENEIIQEESTPEEPETEQAEEEDPVALPCEIKAFLTQYCQGCHGAEAKNGTPLLSLENLHAKSKKSEAQTVGARAIARMIDMQRPMPPAAKAVRPSEADFAMFFAWVEADMPAGHCAD